MSSPNFNDVPYVPGILGRKIQTYCDSEVQQDEIRQQVFQVLESLSKKKRGGKPFTVSEVRQQLDRILPTIEEGELQRHIQMIRAMTNVLAEMYASKKPTSS
jgi:hypothetical protein